MPSAVKSATALVVGLLGLVGAIGVSVSLTAFVMFSGLPAFRAGRYASGMMLSLLVAGLIAYLTYSAWRSLKQARLAKSLVLSLLANIPLVALLAYTYSYGGWTWTGEKNLLNVLLRIVRPLLP